MNEALAVIAFSHQDLMQLELASLVLQLVGKISFIYIYIYIYIYILCWLCFDRSQMETFILLLLVTRVILRTLPREMTIAYMIRVYCYFSFKRVHLSFIWVSIGGNAYGLVVGEHSGLFGSVISLYEQILRIFQ